jgi:CheY-specific phosphatase CheX
VITKQWLTALTDSAEELARTALGWELTRPVDSSRELPDDALGSLVALVGAVGSVAVGIASSRQGCQQLSKALLAMSPDDPDLDEHEVVDAVCEIANIMAGSVKRRVAATSGSLGLGLPLLLQTPMRLATGQRLAVAAAAFGPVPAHLVLIHPFAEEVA